MGQTASPCGGLCAVVDLEFDFDFDFDFDFGIIESADDLVWADGSVILFKGLELDVDAEPEGEDELRVERDADLIIGLAGSPVACGEGLGEGRWCEF
jgi:hypothetical protein